MVARLVLLLATLALMCKGAGAAERFMPLLQTGDVIPPIPLVAQDRRPLNLGDFRGNALAVSFIYTRCTDARMCPLVAAKFAAAQRAIGTAPIRLLLVTLDPSFDTPQVLQRYGRSFGQDSHRWTLATGSPAAITELAARLGIASAQTQPGAIVHTDGAFVIAPDGRIARAIDGNDWSATDLIAFAASTLPGRTDRFGDIRAWFGSAIERCGGGRIALGATALLGLLATSIAVVGMLFWLAFRSKRVTGV